MTNEELEIEEHINDDDEFDEFADEDGLIPCSCSKCFCVVSTEYGEVCGDCLSNQHQG